MSSLPPFHKQAALHRRGFANNHAWWIPLREFVFLWPALLVISAVAILALSLSYVSLVHFDVIQAVDVEGNLDRAATPWGLAAVLLRLVVFLPAIRWAVRKGGRRPFGSVISSRLHLRRQLFTAALPSIVAIHVLGYTVVLLISDTGKFTLNTSALIALGLTIFFVPLQAAAEEVLFRGFLPQILGSSRFPAWAAYALPSVVFVAGHTYNSIGLIDIAVFAACMSALAHKFGGLEIPIAIHVVNNVLFFLLGAVGLLDVDDETVTWATTLLSSSITLAATAWVMLSPKMRAMSEGSVEIP